MALPDEKLGLWKTRSGGPRSPIGKSRSSRNAVRHGCRSSIHLMAHETSEEYDQVTRNWLEHYRPVNPAEFDLVKVIIDTAWRLQRTEYVFSRLEAELFEAALSGAATDDMYKRAELHRRYCTSAQNAFNKAIHLFEFFRRTTPPPPSTIPGPPAEQVVEIRIDEQGETETRLNPTNEDFSVHLLERRNPVLYRWLAFKDGIIPPEYAWAGKPPKDPSLKPPPGGDLLGLQVMTAAQWHDVIGPESLSKYGHVGPTGVGNRLDYVPPPDPDPAATCACPRCDAWRKLR